MLRSLSRIGENDRYFKGKRVRLPVFDAERINRMCEVLSPSGFSYPSILQQNSIPAPLREADPHRASAAAQTSSYTHGHTTDKIVLRIISIDLLSTPNLLLR